MAGLNTCHFIYISGYIYRSIILINKDGDNMADILLKNGDISATPYGDIAVVTSYDEITQSAIDNILTIYGENQYHTDIGNMAYKRRLKISNSGLDIVKQDCINAILMDDRIDSVVSINAEYDKDNANNINISFVIKSTDGTLMSNSITITM